MPSVRRTALIWMTLLLTLVGLLGAGGAYLLDLAEADSLLDGQLRQIALNAAPGLTDAAATVTSPAAARANPKDRVVLQIWNIRLENIYSSEPATEIPRLAEAGFATVQAAGEQWRSYMVSDGTRMVQASQRLDVRTELARMAALEAAGPILVTIPLGWLVVGWGLQRVLGHLGVVAAEVAARGAETRTPIPAAGIPVEVLPLVEAMNLLIERLQTSLEQQRRFLSDAAHELRTPLAALRLQIDNILPAQGSAALDLALPELGRGADRAATLIDQLLRLARYEAVSVRDDPKPVDLVPLILASVADHMQIADGKDVDLGMIASDPAQLRGTETDFKLLFDNLIQNAVRYTPAGGVVDIAIRATDGLVAIEVADTGCGIAEDLLPRVFDRFFRAAPADIAGTGLGLSICKAIADRHGLAITLSNRPGNGVLATVTGRPAVAA